MGTISHLFLWIILWLLLTLKQKWSFKNPNEQVREYSRTVRDNVQALKSDAPLLVIENGKTYKVMENASRKAIIGLAQRGVLGSPIRAEIKPQQGKNSPNPEDDEDIYWLKPKTPKPKENKDSPEGRITWLNKGQRSKSKSGSGSLEERLPGLSGSPCKRTRSSASSQSKSPRGQGKGSNKKGVKFEDLSDSNSEDGDYATLREMVLKREEARDEQQEHKFKNQSESSRSHRRILSADGDYELLSEDTSGHSKDREGSKMAAPVVVHSGSNLLYPIRPMNNRGEQILLGDGYQPLTQLDTNNGQITPKSDSGSSRVSSMSPEKGGCGSESSSGVHSNSSVTMETTNQGTANKRASSSMENLLQDLVVQSKSTPWKSMSLQRNTPPPPNMNSYPLGANTAPRAIKTDGIFMEPQIDSTIVIRRKNRDQSEVHHELQQSTVFSEVISPDSTSSEQFGRATNMRMTSFTDQPDFNPTGTVPLPAPGSPKHNHIGKPDHKYGQPTLQIEYGTVEPKYGSFEPKNNPIRQEPKYGQMSQIEPKYGSFEPKLDSKALNSHSEPKYGSFEPKYGIHKFANQQLEPKYGSFEPKFLNSAQLPFEPKYSSFQAQQQQQQLDPNSRLTRAQAYPPSGANGVPLSALLSNGIYGTTGKPGSLLGPSTLLPMYPIHQRRDSANYSLTSSGESDTYLSHA